MKGLTSPLPLAGSQTPWTFYSHLGEEKEEEGGLGGRWGKWTNYDMLGKWTNYDMCGKWTNYDM